MSLFLPNIPQAPDNLDSSQAQLLANNQGLDTVFGVDHYAFSNATANKGFHNKVTTPLITGSVHPTTVAEPVAYAMQDSANLGVLQYSRGPNDAVPTPLTSLHSTAAAISLATGASTPVIDFTGTTLVHAFLIYSGLESAGANPRITRTYLILWNGSVIVSTSLGGNGTSSAVPFATSAALTIKNTSGSITYTNLFWTLQLIRVQ